MTRSTAIPTPPHRGYHRKRPTVPRREEDLPCSSAPQRTGSWRHLKGEGREKMGKKEQAKWRYLVSRGGGGAGRRQ